MFYKKDVNHVFQPVYSLQQQRAIGFEALMRHAFFPKPDVLFKVADEMGQLNRLDILSIEKAIETFGFGNSGYLFLNVFPTTILASEFQDLMENLMRRRSINIAKIVFELNETPREENVWNTPSFKKQLSKLRQLGCVIALDDVGVGGASLKKVIEFQPDMIKLDRYFSVDLARSKSKQEMITLFVNFCKNHKSTLILEGVEESDDFKTAKRLNVPFVQGYFTGKPFPCQHINGKK